MREPFTSLLSRNEPPLATGECELGVVTGPLAGLAEMLALISPVLSVIALVQLEGWQLKLAGAVLPPFILILLARYPLRRWHRPRQWVAVTGRRVLIWNRPAAIRPNPRIEEIPLTEITDVEVKVDDWDRRTGTAQIVLWLERGQRHIDHVHQAEAIARAITEALDTAAVPADGPVGPPPQDFLPPTKPGDVRPS